MKCNLCGYEFDEKESVSVCQNCSLVKDCKLIKCPNCGYEWPPEPEWLKKLKERRIKKDVKRSSRRKFRNTLDKF